MNEQTGLILNGINNIYTILCEEKTYMGRIKGKILRSSSNEYNPLAPGDMVKIAAQSESEAMILERIPRTSTFTRWNMKRNLPQTLAANIDEIICVTSPEHPPFRPRFIDRVIVCAKNAKVSIIMNKNDVYHKLNSAMQARLEMYASLGYTVMKTSCADDSGISTLEKYISGKTVVFVGQSGVGKSTLVNKLIPDRHQKTGNVSLKYNRGRHVTNYAALFRTEKFSLIDTPGVRELQIPSMELHEVGPHFPEIAERQGSCSFQPCLHRDEPECAVIDAVERGAIHADRYDSYLRMLDAVEIISIGN